MSLHYYHEIILPVKPNLQQKHYDCGAASLQIIAETIGLEIPEEELMKLTKTTSEEGAAHANIARALDTLGIRYNLENEANIELIEHKLRNLELCLVDYQAWFDGTSNPEKLTDGHYSVIFGHNPTHFWVADPSKHRRQVMSPEKAGIRRIRKDLFRKRWIDGYADRELVFRHWMITVPIYQTTPDLKPLKTSH